jgi:hypothetical protein
MRFERKEKKKGCFAALIEFLIDSIIWLFTGKTKLERLILNEDYRTMSKNNPKINTH